MYGTKSEKGQPLLLHKGPEDSGLAANGEDLWGPPLGLALRLLSPRHSRKGRHDGSGSQGLGSCAHASEKETEVEGVKQLAPHGTVRSNGTAFQTQPPDPRAHTFRSSEAETP